MRHIFKHRNKKEYVFQHNINIGQEINANDIQNLDQAVKNKYAFCDCSKDSSLVGILAGTVGFVIGWFQDIIFASSPKVVIVKLIVLALVLLSVGGAIKGTHLIVREEEM